MIVYIPVYTNHWEIVTEESEMLRLLSKRVTTTGDWAVCKHKEHVGFYGTIYNSSTIFTTEEAAYNYIHKNYGAIKDNEYLYPIDMR